MGYYKQCELGKGVLRTVAWLPEKFARQDKYLEIETDDGWSNGWKVLTVNQTRLTEKYMLECSQDWIKTREASDV